MVEEEPQKEVQTGLEEDLKILQLLSNIPNLYIDEDALVFNFYEENFSIYAPSILLPPPEFFI